MHLNIQYKGEYMVTAIILINTEWTQINDVAEQLAEMEGVSEVYSVSGKYDLIASSALLPMTTWRIS